MEPQERIFLKFCSSSAVRDFEKLHYVRKMDSYVLHRGKNSKDVGEVRGHHGQQIHYLIWYEITPNTWRNVGVISGGSAVYAVKARDLFFGIDKSNREKVINGIIDNTLFRIEGGKKNLATRVLSMWRKQVALDWRSLYDAEPYGFETFVEEADIIRADGSSGRRSGALYKADNWTLAGASVGNTKHHIGRGLTGGLAGRPFVREQVPPKLCFCKWIGKERLARMCEYKSSWRLETTEEKTLAALRSLCRNELMRRDTTKAIELGILSV